MNDDKPLTAAATTIASIENKRKPGQVVDIRYVAEEGAFVTAGIEAHFAEKEIMIPSRLVLQDFQLMGTILSALLEKLSEAQDAEAAFSYASHFEAMGRVLSAERRRAVYAFVAGRGGQTARESQLRRVFGMRIAQYRHGDEIRIGVIGERAFNRLISAVT